MNWRHLIAIGVAAALSGGCFAEADEDPSTDQDDYALEEESELTVVTEVEGAPIALPKSKWSAPVGAKEVVGELGKVTGGFSAAPEPASQLGPVASSPRTAKQ